METVNEIKERLSAKSRTATLDELRSEGRKKVRLIRAEHIAAMVSQAVHAAIEGSGLIDPAEHERLVEKSREEFKSIIEERQQETRHAREIEERLEERERELEDLKQRCSELTESLADARTAAEAQSAAAAPAPAPAAGSNELLMSMFQEMANMKASMQQTQQAAPAQDGGGADLSAALDKLTSSLNDRLESFGKKMGISAAVGGDGPTDFSALFKDEGGESLESNMSDIKVKKKTGGGIAANLERLKKLKGGG